MNFNAHINPFRSTLTYFQGPTTPPAARTSWWWWWEYQVRRRLSSSLLTFHYYALASFILYLAVLYHRSTQLASPLIDTAPLVSDHRAHHPRTTELYEHLLRTVLVMFERDFWISLNAAYCTLIIFGKVIQKVVFGKLRTSEQSHLKDKLCNFIFYKFIFIFGVINVQYVEEVTWWTTWFAVTCFIHAFSLLLQERMNYLSFSPSTSLLVKVKLWVLLLSILFWTSSISIALTMAYLKYGMLGFGVYTFMIAEYLVYETICCLFMSSVIKFMEAWPLRLETECLLLQLKAIHILYNAIINLYDSRHVGCWETKNIYAYYGDLIFSLAILLVDLLYHIEMLFWGNIFLSMASLVICMQLRWLFNEIRNRLRKHQNYLAVVRQMELYCPMATPEEIEDFDNRCSICWDRMRSARKLPCHHIFHNACLRSWLEHDSSCPTCRRSLRQPPATAAATIDGSGSDVNGAPRDPRIRGDRNLNDQEHHLPLSPTIRTERQMYQDGRYRIIETLLVDRGHPAHAPVPGYDSYLNRLADRLHAFNHRLVSLLLDLAFSPPHHPTALGPLDNQGVVITGESVRHDPSLPHIPAPPHPGPTHPSPSPPPTTESVNRVNHFFHFDASRYISWLPSFSLQVSHLRIQPLIRISESPGSERLITVENRNTNPNGYSPSSTYQPASSIGSPTEPSNNTMLLGEMVRQVSHLFPYISESAVRRDLEVTWSPDRTAENILEGHLDEADFEGEAEGDSSSIASSSSSTSLSSDSNSLFSYIDSATYLTSSETSRHQLSDSALYGSRNISPLSSLASTSQVDEGKNIGHNKSPFVSYASHFSTNSKEREDILSHRKKDMLQQARMRFTETNDDNDKE